MNDNVLYFKGQKPAEPTEQDEPVETTFLSEEEVMLVESLERAVTLAKSGRLKSFILLAKDKQSPHFYSDVHYSEDITTSGDTNAYVGRLETLKCELTQMSLMTPELIETGEIVNPYEEQ